MKPAGLKKELVETTNPGGQLKGCGSCWICGSVPGQRCSEGKSPMTWLGDETSTCVFPSPRERKVSWEGRLLAFGTERTWLLVQALASQLELVSQPRNGDKGVCWPRRIPGHPKTPGPGKDSQSSLPLPSYKDKAPFLLYQNSAQYRNSLLRNATAVRENSQVPGSCSEIQSSLKISETAGNKAVTPERVHFHQPNAR